MTNPTIVAAMLAAAVGLITAALALAGVLLTLRVERQQRREQETLERVTLRNAVEGEWKSVRDVVERKVDYIWNDYEWDQSKCRGLKEGFEDEPLNWAPIHIPVWNAIVQQGKVGLLPPEKVQDWTWFFRYVSWMNDDLLPLHKRSKNDLPKFAGRVVYALESLLQGGWRARNVRNDRTPKNPHRDGRDGRAEEGLELNRIDCCLGSVPPIPERFVEVPVPLCRRVCPRPSW